MHSEKQFPTAFYHAPVIIDNLLVDLTWILTAREGLVIPQLHFDQLHREFHPYPERNEPQSNY